MASRDVPQPFVSRRDRVDWPKTAAYLVVIPAFILACFFLLGLGIGLALRWGLFDQIEAL